MDGTHRCELGRILTEFWGVVPSVDVITMISTLRTDLGGSYERQLLHDDRIPPPHTLA